MPPSVGWIVQPALFETPPGYAPDSWAVAQALVEADERHIPIALAAGFDTLWVEDHLGWGDRSHLECLTTLAWLAGRHAGARWGTMVCGQAFRNPAYLAKVAVNLQLLTGGRFVLGLGAGNNGAEHAEFGYPFPPPAVRIAQLEEAARIIRALWVGGRQTLHGRDYRVAGAVVAPRLESRIPLMIGGGGERLTLRVVADLADWWCADVEPVETFARRSAALTAHCEALGRDPATLVRSQVAWLSIDDDPAKLVRRDDLHVVAGSPDEVAAELIRFRRAGVDHFQLRFMDFPSPAGLECFVDRVLPLLRQVWD